MIYVVEELLPGLKSFLLHPIVNLMKIIVGKILALYRHIYHILIAVYCIHVTCKNCETLPM